MRTKFSLLPWVSILAMTLPGCAAYQQAQEQAAAQHYSAMQNTCASYGFQPGTDAFANCLMRIDQMQRGQANQAVQAYIQQSQEQTNALNAQVRANRPVQTQCYRVGNSVQCTTY
jgi:hypothetical protein